MAVTAIVTLVPDRGQGRFTSGLQGFEDATGNRDVSCPVDHHFALTDRRHAPRTTAFLDDRVNLLLSQLPGACLDWRVRIYASYQRQKAAN
jgi:hypothetical protein